MPLKLKMDGDHAVLLDGKPVYISDDGAENAYDVNQMMGTISARNGEAKAFRERAETAERAVKSFEGITDPAAAIKALGIVGNLDAKKLIDAGEAERVKADVVKTYTEKLTAAEKRAADLEGNWSKAEINRAFASSQFIKDKTAIPADFLQAALSDRMKFEGGKVTVYDTQGNKMLSRAKPGEDAGFDEALSMLVDAHPQRDSILKGNSNGGSGARQSNGQGAGTGQITRTQFDALSQAERMKAVTGGATVVD